MKTYKIDFPFELSDKDRNEILRWLRANQYSYTCHESSKNGSSGILLYRKQVDFAIVFFEYDSDVNRFLSDIKSYFPNNCIITDISDQSAYAYLH